MLILHAELTIVSSTFWSSKKLYHSTPMTSKKSCTCVSETRIFLFGLYMVLVGLYGVWGLCPAAAGVGVLEDP